MSGRPVDVTPEARFRAAVEAKVREMDRPRPFEIPRFQADPPEQDPTNLWMRWDGRLRGRYWNGASYTYVDYPMRSDITAPPAVPAAPAPPAPGTIPQTYETTWTATWSQTYQGNDTKRTDTAGETQLYFGQVDTTLGLQKSLVGFDGVSLVSTLTGSTIQKIELTMTLLGAYWSSVKTQFGLHNLSAEPVTFDGTTIDQRKVGKGTFSVSGNNTIALPLAFAQSMRAGTAKGLAIEAPSADREFYGFAAGVGSGYTPPKLTITYAK